MSSSPLRLPLPLRRSTAIQRQELSLRRPPDFPRRNKSPSEMPSSLPPTAALAQAIWAHTDSEEHIPEDVVFASPTAAAAQKLYGHKTPGAIPTPDIGRPQLEPQLEQVTVGDAVFASQTSAAARALFGCTAPGTVSTSDIGRPQLEHVTVGDAVFASQTSAAARALFGCTAPGAALTPRH